MGRHDLAFNASGSRKVLATGLYASTVMQMERGWLRLSDVMPGDLAVTQDAGLSPVLAINLEFRRALWSVHVPPGALGNDAPLLLPPGQPVLIETPFAWPYCGEARALVPAMALEGWHGITPHVPARPEPILQLRLGSPALVRAGPGILVGVDGVSETALDLHRLLALQMRHVVPLASARQLVASLIAEEAGIALSRQATAFCPPNRV